MGEVSDGGTMICKPSDIIVVKSSKLDERRERNLEVSPVL